ncbi:hypothetical protein HZH66_009314 [Vespula vulgaris]|uniref:Kinesin motor domain-containing protein n=3 Tax=Vespula vulgaris TaxID=7454 RepID=A0A834JMA8_VESVU|nr:hypothetical protein HZH66_009314 [Vespula vulgaris]
MPRSIRDSDEDVETKTATGRRTRAGFGSFVTDSPVRRSSRNKQSTKQSGSPPDLYITEISAQGTRTFRTRAGTADSDTLETQKRLRSNKNSVDTEFETLIETQPKKMTRRSLAATTALDTPKANTRSRRMTRAGSETISTPIGRTTRKTRASSMDPEPTITEPVEEVQNEVMNTPMRAKRRASVLPSQSTVIEEEEKQFPIIELDKIVIETETSPINIISTNIKSPNKQLEFIDKMEEEKDCYSAVKGPLDDSSEKNHMEISETFKTEVKSSDESYTPEKDKYSAANVNDDILTKDVSKQSPHNFEDISKESKSKDENILHVSIEEKKMNSSNKENECLNTNNSVSDQNKTTSNIKNLHQETSIIVLDTKEGKNVESNDNINPDNSHLIESSVSLSDCNNSIKSNSNVNTNEVNYLEEEDKSVSMSDTKKTPSNEEEHEKTSINKEQSKINDGSNDQIQEILLIEEEKSIEIVDQNISNIEEINSNDKIKDKANVPVNPEEKLIDISVNEDNCNNDVNATEVLNDEKISDSTTAKVISASKDSNVTQGNNSSNDNQDNMSCTSTVDSSFLTLEFSDDSIKDSANNAKQTELDSTKSLLKLKSSKHSTSIPEKIDSSTVAESHDIPEADLPDEEGSKMQSSSNTPVMSKTKSVTELNISKSKKEKKKNDVQNDDECENISDIRMLFQDISADEWKQKNKNINIETRSNLMHSTSTGKLETDSETECDLLLVDKKAWLAAEKLKASKDKEKFDYDSDDTIILKTKLDYLNDKLSNTNKIEIKSKDSIQENDNNSEVKESMEKSINSSKSSTKEAKDKLDEVERTPNKLNDKTNIDKSEIDISSHSASKKEKSQKSTPVCNRSVLVKSLDKQLEEEEVSLSQQVFEDQEAKTTVDVINKVEVNTLENKLERQSLDKKQKKNRSLNSSLNKSDKSKQRLVRHNRLNISSSEEEDNAINLEKNENKLTKGSGKKRYNKNYSTMVHIGSDSDTCDESIDSSNSGIRNKTPRIPRFLFKHKDDEEENEGHNESGDESNEDKFSDRSIDSDINAEYNLDGKTIGKFSDDDIPGDECRASESEFSDPDDNGSDLADFVVDDDEVEEEDEEEDEGEDEEEDEGEDEEQEEEKENQDIESEEDKKLTENKNEKKEAEDTEDTEKSCEKKLEDIDEEEVNKEAQNKSINVSDIKSDKKKNLKQKVNIEIHSSGSDEDEIVCENKIDTISELDSNTSGKKPKKKQKLNEDNEIIEETSKKELNESEIVFAKKVKGTNISLTCSTPKTDTFQQKQFNKQNISSNEEQENIHLKDLSSDNCDTSKSSITNSKNSKKKRSIENNISTDLLELLKDANLPKTLLSKKAYLNKTISPCSETPTTKYLKKQKLNDSAPNINLEKNKNASETELIDDKNDEQSESRTITAETTELLESNSSASVKRKRYAEINDSNDQIELRNKKNKINSKLEIHIEFDNEKENSENVLKVNDEKKKRKRKKNRKNKNSKELDLVNIATTVEKKNIEKGEKMEIVTSNESKKNKKKNKNKEDIENKEKSNEKFMSTTKNDQKSVEIENIPNKKKKKTTSEVPTLQVKEQSKKSLRKNILKSSTMSVAKVSNEMPQNTEFFKSKHEALEAAKRAAESIKANKDMNKNKQRKQLEKIQQEKDIKAKKSDEVLIKTFTRGIKRLPADVIENLSDVPMNPFKKTKLLKNPVQQTVRSPTSMMKNGFTESGITKAKKNYIPSNSGGTTEFDVVNLQKEKKLKKTSTVVSFRNKMLSRNSRYPFCEERYEVKMNNTLDSIRPSDKTHSREEMSYLFGRDPSILAYGQRPCPSQETKKNLLSAYEIEFDSAENIASLLSDSQSLKTIKVYLRLKPFPRKVKLLPQQEEAYKVINSTTLATKLPCLENNSSFARSKTSEITSRTYTFTQTFGPEITQLELFDQAIKQQMFDFLAGQSCNVMTYGTTNSGKSYTLQGTITSPGIIPRALEFVFSIITPKPIPSYKPVHHCDAIFLNSLERAQELEAKTKLLSFSSVDKNQYINTYKQMQTILQEESPLRPSECSDAHYSVWVSFAEIYNETIYDLLSIDCQKKKVPLKLATDNRGRAFIKGLNTVYVNSGAEAYQVLMAGQYNLKVAATALNARSSRSHCIFTIKLLKYCSENLTDSVDISTFSFCDLAGSERLKKTLNIGDRLKEAQNINTSLLVLGKCLKSIYDGQLSKLKSEPIIGPFRESKLTRLFQRALSGREQIALIVNVNPLPNLYIETQNVLNFAAIAKKIIIEPKIKEQRKANSRFSKIVQKSIQSVTNWDDTVLESADSLNTEAEADILKFSSEEEYEHLLMENKELRKEITDLKNMALTRDFEIRQEMVDTYTTIIKKLENDWKARIRDVEEQQEDTLQWSIKQVEKYYKQKMAQLSSRKRQRSCLSDENDYADQTNVFESEISQLTSKVVSMKDTIQELKKSNQVLSIEKNKIEFELSLTKDDLKHAKCLLDAAQKDLSNGEETEYYIEEIKSQLSSKEEHIKKLKEFLNEAKEEYITITNDARKKEIQIKEQEELMVEYEDKIDELQEQFDRANYCLAEQTKTIEVLEDNNQSMMDKIFELENKLKLLNVKYEVTSCKEEMSEKSENYVTSDSCEDVIIKTELISEDEIQLEEKINNLDTKKEISEEKIMLESEEKGIQTKCEELVSKEDKSCQTITLVTQEVIMQTSILEEFSKEISVQTNDNINYEEREKEYKELKAKCNEVEEEYKQAHIKLGDDLKIIKELQEKITELDINLDAKQKEKYDLEMLMEENIKQQQALQEKLEEFNKKEKDKDDEIIAIQKELKQMIQAKDAEEKSTLSMEKELKETLRALDDTKKVLSYKEQQVENLETRLKSLEQTAKFLEILQKDKEEQQSEREKLRKINDMLKEDLATKEREMEEFKKNRNETLNKYDNLIKSLQEDVDRQKREVMRYQELFCRQTTPTPSKEECKKLRSHVEYLQEKLKNYETSQKSKENENNTENEVVSIERSTKRKGRKKEAPLPPQPEVIDLSGSESKRDAKHTVELPGSEQTERKRTTRKKKLFIANDESLQDIDPVEIDSTPSIPLRSLRSRRNSNN